MARRGQKYCLERTFSNPIGPGMAALLSPIDGKSEKVVLAVPAFGWPLPDGAQFVDVDQDETDHYYIKPMRTVSKGPIKVSTPAYRKGWDKAFGSKGVN